jgi:hypothetical protein
MPFSKFRDVWRWAGCLKIKEDASFAKGAFFSLTVL